MLPPSTKYEGFYQELLKGIGSYKELGNRLIRQAEQAHALRQFHKVKEIALILSNIPIKLYQEIAHYFLAVAANSRGNGDQNEARRLFELTIKTAPDAYKIKAILSLGALSFHKRDFDAALYFYQETVRAGKLSAASLHAIKAISVLRAMQGNHKQAVNLLENFLPVIRYAPAHIHFDFLNSYAVELAEVGRKDEARNISRIVVLSPFIHAYPEWQETARDLKEPNRSFVAFRFVESKFVKIEPASAQPSSKEAETEPPTKILEFSPSVVPFPPLKEAPRPNKPKRLKSQEAEYMNIADKKEYIMAAIKSGAIPESEYKRMMYLLGLVESGPAEQIIDLEDDALLDSIIMNWCNLIEPEQFVAVMSALRDCKDDLRRRAIMENIISIAFHQTASHTDSETEWRRKVECRLPEK